jgi:uncharacterized protein
VFFSIRELEFKKIRFEVDFQPGQIAFEQENMRQVSPLHVEGGAELLNNTLGEVRIKGKLNVGLEMDCDRCLDPVPYLLETDFDLFYRPAPADSAPGHEVELDDGESQVGFYEGAGIELGDIIREHILLSIPMQMVCGEGCQGICPICGVNRNTGECHCETKPADDRWTALRGLRESLGTKLN